MQNKTLSSKVALITGASRRIGAAIARILHENGMNVVIHYHTHQEEAESLCHTLNAKRPHSCTTVQANLKEETAWKQVINHAIFTFNRLDVLVNNASLYYPTPIESAKISDWDALMDVNLKAPFFLAQIAAPHLQKYHGSIVNIADIHGIRPMKNYSLYSISKAGLHMLTKTLARELGPDIRVNSVSPGPILWPEGENALTDARKKEIIALTLLKKSGNAIEIAKAVLFLVQDADYMTGQDIIVDGGRSILLS
jgi:pteridine reductase